ncbi:MAG: hypothetical protein ACFFDH_00090 [Promethearchaeota archaeon]
MRLSQAEFDELNAGASLLKFIEIDPTLVENAKKKKDTETTDWLKLAKNIDLNGWLEACNKANVEATKICWGLEGHSLKRIPRQDFKELLEITINEDPLEFKAQEEKLRKQMDKKKSK